MDPLSVTASIANLIQLAAVIGSTVYRLHQGTTGAPDSARRLRDELASIRTVLIEVARFVNDQTLSEHGVHVSIRNFLEVVSDCLLTFSVLDRLVEELASDNSGLIPRMRWALKERDIAKWTERLVRHQNILNTMLGISQLRVARDIQADIRNLTTELTALRTDMIDSQLSARIEERLTSSYDYTTGSLIPAEARTSSEDTESLRSSSSRPSRSYSATLRQSMVYRRVRWRASRHNIQARDSRSTISTMTVGEASNLSAYAIPLYPNEVSSALSSLSGRSISFRAPPSNPPPFSPEEVVQAQIFELPAEPVNRSLPPIPGDPAFLRAVVISAATSGDDDVVLRLIPFINSLAPTDRTTLTTQLLHLAITHQKLEIVRILLTTAHASVNHPDPEGRLAIHHAVRLGSPPLISTLLWEYPPGSLIAHTDTLGRTAIHELILSRHPHSESTTILKTLLDHSPITLNSPDTAGETPLHLAVACADINLVKLILQPPYSANINLLNASSQLPIQLALESESRTSPPTRQIIQLLVSLHTKPEIAAITTSSIRKGWGIATLGSARADFSTPDPATGMPALHTAIHYGKIISAKVLIDNFCESPYSLTAEGYTVLHGAATCEASVDVERLLKWLVEDRKVPVDWAGHRVDTPLLWAVKKGRYVAARVLVDLGANVFVRDREGNTARDVVVGKGEGEMAAVLLAEVLLEREEGVVGKAGMEGGREWVEGEELGIPDDAEPGMITRIWIENQRAVDFAGPNRSATVAGGAGNWRPWERSHSPAIRAPGRNQSLPDTFYSTSSAPTPQRSIQKPRLPTISQATSTTFHRPSKPTSQAYSTPSPQFSLPPKISQPTPYLAYSPISELDSAPITKPNVSLEHSTPRLPTKPQPYRTTTESSSSSSTPSPVFSFRVDSDKSDITDPDTSDDDDHDQVENELGAMTLKPMKLELELDLAGVGGDGWMVGIEEALRKTGVTCA